MSLKQTLKRGQELREAALRASTQQQQVEEPQLTDPSVNFPRHLTERAALQLREWAKHGKSYDYQAERERLLLAFGETARTLSAQEYVEKNLGIALGLVGTSKEEFAPLEIDNRKELITDTLARWLWLEKRHDPKLNLLTPQTAREAAMAALELEMSRARGKKGHGK